MRDSPIYICNWCMTAEPFGRVGLARIRKHMKACPARKEAVEP